MSKASSKHIVGGGKAPQILAATPGDGRRRRQQQRQGAPWPRARAQARGLRHGVGQRYPDDEAVSQSKDCGRMRGGRACRGQAAKAQRVPTPRRLRPRTTRVRPTPNRPQLDPQTDPILGGAEPGAQLAFLWRVAVGNFSKPPKLFVGSGCEVSPGAGFAFSRLGAEAAKMFTVQSLCRALVFTSLTGGHVDASVINWPKLSRVSWATWALRPLSDEDQCRAKFGSRRARCCPPSQTECAGRVLGRRSQHEEHRARRIVAQRRVALAAAAPADRLREGRRGDFALSLVCGLWRGYGGGAGGVWPKQVTVLSPRFPPLWSVSGGILPRHLLMSVP